MYAISPTRLQDQRTANEPISNISLVQAEVMDGLGDTGDEDRASLGEIGNGACDLWFVIRAGRERSRHAPVVLCKMIS